MKKILISILIILLLVMIYFAFAKGISFLGIKSINSIKTESQKLDSDFNQSRELYQITYPEEVDGLEEAIKTLKISKQEYENKSSYNSETESMSGVQVKKYMIHYLWTILGNYRKDRGVQSLNLDLKATQTEDVYDLEFTLLGSYTSITDFIYDIENDEELNFEIKNFGISSEITKITTNNTTSTNNTENSKDTSNNESKDGNSTQTQQNNNSNNNNNNNNNSNSSNKSTTKSDGVILEAKFTVENIGITLD